MDRHVRQSQFLCQGALRKSDEKKHANRKKQSFHGSLHSSFGVPVYCGIFSMSTAAPPSDHSI
jgi:hypothetical protein